MSISRRIFIQTASIAAIAAGVMVRPGLMAWAQGANQAAATSTDPLAYYTQATFTQYLNSVFRLHGFRTVDVTLEQVRDTLPANVSRTGGRESFVLSFRGGSAFLPQGTYTVEHAALGTFLLFLVPGGADENGAQGYVATINRLAYTAKPTAQPKAMPRKSVPSSTPTTEPSSPKPRTTPETKSPDPHELPKPQGQPRSRKPSPELMPELEIQ